jgi:hypothetical protein
MGLLERVKRGLSGSEVPEWLSPIETHRVQNGSDRDQIRSAMPVIADHAGRPILGHANREPNTGSRLGLDECDEHASPSGDGRNNDDTHSWISPVFTCAQRQICRCNEWNLARRLMLVPLITGRTTPDNSGEVTVASQGRQCLPVSLGQSRLPQGFRPITATCILPNRTLGYVDQLDQQRTQATLADLVAGGLTA